MSKETSVMIGVMLGLVVGVVFVIAIATIAVQETRRRDCLARGGAWVVTGESYGTMIAGKAIIPTSTATFGCASAPVEPERKRP